MKHFISLCVAFTSVSAFAAKTFCSQKDIQILDPHQSPDAIESFIASNLYLSIFPESGAEGVADSWEQKTPKVWIIKLKKNISFQTLNGWKPARPLTSDDVVYSLQRQLFNFAKTVHDENSFFPAKLSGLEKNIEKISKTNAHEIELIFKTDTSIEALKSYLARPVGYVLSKEFADKKAQYVIDFFPANGKMRIKETRVGKIVLERANASDKNTEDLLTYVELGRNDLKIEEVEKSGCKRLFYPPKNIVQLVDQKKVRGAKAKLSQSQFFFKPNPKYSLSAKAKETLSAMMNPGMFNSLKEFNPSSAIFGPGKPADKANPQKATSTQNAYMMTCKYNELKGIDSESFQEEISMSFMTNFNIHLSFVPVDCESLNGFRGAPDVVGTLGIFEYQMADELVNAVDCAKVTKSPFGFCMDKPDKAKIDSEINKKASVYPLARFENYLIEFY